MEQSMVTLDVLTKHLLQTGLVGWAIVAPVGHRVESRSASHLFHCMGSTFHFGVRDIEPSSKLSSVQKSCEDCLSISASSPTVVGYESKCVIKDPAVIWSGANDLSVASHVIADATPGEGGIEGPSESVLDVVSSGVRFAQLPGLHERVGWLANASKVTFTAAGPLLWKLGVVVTNCIKVGLTGGLPHLLGQCLGGDMSDA